MSARTRAARIGLVALEVAGAALAAAAGLAGFLAWRIQSGPVSLSMLRPSAEFAVERALPHGHRAQIGDIVLSKGEGGAFRVALDGVAIADPAGAEMVSLARVDAAFAVSDLAKADFGPRLLIFDRPVISFTRADGAIKTDAAGSGEFDLIRLLNDHAWLRNSFQKAEFRDATILYRDAASGRTWRSEGAAASLFRTKDGFGADLSGRFDIDGKPAALSLAADYSEENRAIDAELKLADAPVGDLLGMFYGEQARLLEAPVSGLARMKFTDKGVIRASTFDLSVGSGALRFGARRIPVGSAALSAHFDPAANAFNDIKISFSAGGSSGAATGRVALALDEQKGAVRRIDFSLVAGDFILGPEGVFAAPLAVERASLVGAYDVDERRLRLEAVEAAFLGVVFKGGAEIRRPPAAAKLSPAVRVDLAMEGALDPPRIAAGWPLKLATSVREFIDTRLPAARVSNLKFALDLKEGALGAGAALPDDALALTFDVADATAIYTPGMTPLTEASATARLTGNRFVMSDAKGRVGAVPVFDGEIDFTRLSPKGAPVNYTFSARGAAQDFLRILNQRPLALLRTTNLSPAQFSGSARARVTISRPNLKVADRSAYGYSGSLRFDDVVISDFFRGGDLEGASGDIDLKSRSMDVRADARFGGAPVKIGWTQRFYAGDGPSRFDVEGVFDNSMGDVFGVPTRQFLRGPVGFKAAAVGDLGAIRSLSLEADFTKAALTAEPINWRKASDIRAAGRMEVSFAPDAVAIRSASLEGDDIAVSGRVALTPAGALLSAEFDRIHLGSAADVSLRAARDASGALKAEITGAYLDAGPLIERMVSGPRDPKRPDPWRNGLAIDARLAEVRMRSDARFGDVALHLRRAESLEALDFTATSAGGKPAEVRLAPAANGAKAIDAKSGDLGALFTGVFGVTSVKGGEGAMALTLAPPAADGKSAIEGRADARNLRIVKAPLLARIFAAGSFDGLADLLNGEGIDLAKARTDFAYRDGVISIRNARATGPSIGITGEGAISAGKDGAVALAGAVAPAYQLNSFLGRAPIVGDLLINRKGEGLVALSYSISGPTSSPAVTVNPLSALTPGVLRRMFEGREEGAPAN